MAGDEALKAASRALTDSLPEDLLPVEIRTRAMFGGYKVYATVLDASDEDFASNPDKERGVAVINDGHLFLKKKTELDDRIGEIAELAPMYPGGANMWRIDASHLDPASEVLRELIVDMWRIEPKKKPRKPRKPRKP